MSVAEFYPTFRVVEERGIRIYSGDDGDDIYVFVPESLLVDLAERDRWASQFGQVPLIVNRNEGVALAAAGLAEKETRGGFHGTDLLRERLTEWGWM